MVKIERERVKEGDVIRIDNNNILVCDAWGTLYIYNIYNLPKEDKEKFLALSDGKKMENMALDYMNAMYDENDIEAWSEWED